MSITRLLRCGPQLRQRIGEIITDSQPLPGNDSELARREQLAAISSYDAEQEYFQRGVGKAGLNAEVSYE